MPQERISGPISLAFPELTAPTKPAPAAERATSFGDYLQRVAGESRRASPAAEPTHRATAPAEPDAEATDKNAPNSASEQNAADDAKTEEFTSPDPADVREDEPVDEAQEQDIEDVVEINTTEADAVIQTAATSDPLLKQGRNKTSEEGEPEQPVDGQDKTSGEQRPDVQHSRPDSKNGMSKNEMPSDSRLGSQQALPSEGQSLKDAATSDQAAIQISEREVENNQAANLDEPPTKSSQAKPAGGADTLAGKAGSQAAERVETSLPSANRESESTKATVRPETVIASAVPVDDGGDDRGDHAKEDGTEHQSQAQSEPQKIGRPLAASEQRPSDQAETRHVKTNPSVVDAVLTENIEAVTKDQEDVVMPERDIVKAEKIGADTGSSRSSSETISLQSDTQTRDGRTLASRSLTNAPAEPRISSSAESVRFVQRVAGAFRVARDRGGEVQLRLSPPELGSLRVELAIKNGVLTARLEAETQAARTTLLDNLPMLRDRLAEQNIKIDRFDVDVREESSGRSRERASEEGRGEPRENRDPAHSENEDRSAGARHNISSPGRITAGANDGQLNVVV